MPETSWLKPIFDSFKTQTATWLVTFLIALLTLFSSKITESVKFALNRADLRSKYYEEIAMDLSEFIFQAELTVEFVHNGWTTPHALVPLVKDYNDSITKFRKKEFVYTSWVGHYWGEDKATKFATVAEAVKEFDKAIHSLNDELEAVNIKKSKPKMDPEKAKQAVGRMRPALEKLQTLSKEFIIGLR
jgi:hypothetical protein